MKSPHSQAAQQIRKALKVHGIAATVRSRSFSMGSSVDVELLNNPTPATVKKVAAFADQYQQGDFNGMEDIYEYRAASDLPQAKFVFVSTEYTDEFKQLAWDHVRATVAYGDEAPESYSDGADYMLQSIWGSDWVRRVLGGKDFPEFWTTNKPRIAA